MSIAEIITEVQEYTGRPDSHSLAIIKSTVRRAILGCHAAAFFQNDVKKVTVSGFAPDGTGKFTFSRTGELPRFRDLFQLIAFYQDGTTFDKFEKVSEECVTDYYGFSSSNYYRILGDDFTVGYPGRPSNLQVRYFGFPEIDMIAETTDSWIVNEYSIPIPYLAAALVFDSTGEDDSASKFRALYLEAVNELITNYPAIK